MKKTTVFILIFSLILALSACGKTVDNDKTRAAQSEITESEVKSTPETSNTEQVSASDDEGIGDDTPYCGHTNDYHTLDGNAIDYVNNLESGAADKYIDLFGETEDCNIRAFMDYFGIPKQDYWKLHNKEFMLQYPDFYDMNVYDPDRWFADDYYEDPYFIRESETAPDAGSVMIKPSADTNHTDRYYTIHGALIKFVGQEKFDEFKNKFGGTEDYNVLNFIKYFSIRKDDFSKCTDLPEENYGIYNTEYVYGTAEMQKEYFEKHILTE